MGSERRAAIVLGAVLVAAIIMVTASLRRPQPTSYVPTARAQSSENSAGRMTVDASDEHAWRFLDLERGELVDSTAAWDLAFQRFHVRLYRGPELDKWYDYSFTSHLLTPKDRVYDVATRAGRRAQLRFLSYYCPGATPGCVTLEWQWLD